MNHLDRARTKIDLRFAFDTFVAVLKLADIHQVEEIQQTLGTLQMQAKDRRVHLVLRKSPSPSSCVDST